MCKRLHRGILKQLGNEFFDPIGIMYVHNPFGVKKTSKFRSRQDSINQNNAKRRLSVNAMKESDAIKESSEEFTNQTGYDPINEGELFYNSIKVSS